MQTLKWIIKNKPLGTLGLVILVFWTLVSIFATQIAPHDPARQAWKPLLSPSGEHLMGTDSYGRDVFSRVIFGSRISMWVGVSTVAISLVLSLGIGVPTALRGGAPDMFIGRCVDILMSFPSLLFALLLTTVLGQNLQNVIIAIAFVRIVHGTRMVRSLVLAERENEYVTAAEVIGGSTIRISFRHIVPNIIPLVIVGAAGGIGDSILAEASLSFLGLGVPPPAATWANVGYVVGGRLSASEKSRPQ